MKGEATACDGEGAGRRALITLGVILGVTMTTLDTTVVNVALPHMQASLSASPEQITWTITSYMVATAVMTPLSGWLAKRFGIKNLLLVAISGFTAVSILCGAAASLAEMVAFRLLQGAMSAFIGPLAQVVLLDINPPRRHARAMALFSMAMMVAPIIGPVVGGLLTDELSWRWCFYINLPAGIATVLLIWIFMPGAETKAPRFDFLGFCSLGVAVAAFQLMLDRGTTQDWFASPEICAEAIVAAMAFWVYGTHTLTAAHPLFPPALIRDRNFVMSVVCGMLVYALFMTNLVLLPMMMQGVMGYTVIHTGLLSAPRGVAIVAVIWAVGRLDAYVDRKVMISIGLVTLACAFWEMGLFDLSMTDKEIVSATVLQGIGQGIVMVPLTTLGFATIPANLRADASSALGLLRGMASSTGLASFEALTAVNTQTMHASLASLVRPDDPNFAAGLAARLRPDTAAGALALNDEITRQATMVAYVNDFRLLAGLALLCLPLVLMMRRPRRTLALVAAVEDTMHA
ncbi:MAG: DHA2 family efflux MFS transporter permease subunit [Caulobacteraceae bacterium]|nr:DHA2 family efflux MFS transporter permease subunit [Caulobacteraceae bacterium]